MLLGLLHVNKSSRQDLVSLGCEGMGYFSFTLFCILQLHDVSNLYADMHDHTNTHYMHTCTLISGYHEVLTLPSEDHVPLSLQTVNLQELRNI